MRFEKHLIAIYERWLDQPQNHNVPKVCAREAQYSVGEEQWQISENEFHGDVTTRRRYTRLWAQNHWLTRFIAAWEYFEGKDQ